MEQIVVITGASSGLGKMLKEKFRTDGHTVYNLSRTNRDNDANFIACDVRSAGAVKDAMDSIGAKHDRIDILVNNAGFGNIGEIVSTEDEEVDALMGTNFTGTFYAAKYAAPYMKQGAKIINMSSICAFFSMPFRGFYSCSKAATNMLSFDLRMQMRPMGINVVAICPGEIDTPFPANRHIEVKASNEINKQRIENVDALISSKARHRMNADKAVAQIYKIINKKKAKACYIIGRSYKLLHFASRFISINAWVNLTDKKYGGHKRKK